MVPELERDLGGIVMTHEEEVEHVEAGEKQLAAGAGRLGDFSGVSAFEGIVVNFSGESAFCSAAGVGLISRSMLGTSSSESARSTCSAEASLVVHERSGRKNSSAGFRSPASGPVAVQVSRRIRSIIVSM